MPTSPPILAIKEANEHLLALFTENQLLETNVNDLKDELKGKQEKIDELEEEVNKLKRDHEDELNSTQESLKMEHDNDLTLQIKIMEINHERKLGEQEEFFKQELEDMLSKQYQTLLMEKEKALCDLENELKRKEEDTLIEQEIMLKEEERRKIDGLEKIISEQKERMEKLEYEIENMKHYFKENTCEREVKVRLLTDVFNSTIENMSLCIKTVSESNFIHSDKLVPDNYINHSMNKYEHDASSLVSREGDPLQS